MKLRGYLFLLMWWPLHLVAQNIVPAIQHGHFDDVVKLELDEPEHRLYSYSKNQQMVTWDLKTGMMMGSARGNEVLPEVNGKTSDSDTVVLGDTVFMANGALLKMTVKNQVIQSRTTTYYDLGYTSLHAQHNNPYLFAGSHDGRIYVYEKKTLKLLTHLKEHHSDVLCLNMTSDGHLLYSSGKDRSIIEWDARGFSFKRRFYGHSNRITSLIFSPGGDSVYFGNELGQLKIFSIAGYTNELGQHSISNYELTNLQWRKHFKKQELIITSHDNRVYAFDAGKEKKSTLIKYHHLSVRHAKHFVFERMFKRYTHAGIDEFATDYNINSNSIAIAANESFNRKRRKVVIKDFDRGGRKVIRSDYERFKNVCVVNDTLVVVHRVDGMDFMSANNDAELTLWKIKGGKKYKHDADYTEVQAVAAFGGRYLYIAVPNGLKVWDLAQNTVQAVLGPVYNKLEVQGNYLFGITGKTATVFKITDNGSVDKIADLTGHTEAVTDISVNEKRGLIATASNDASIRFFNMQGQHLATLVPTGQKDFILLAPDNTYQITKNAYKKFGFASGSGFIFPDQFDLVFNKPHVVQNALGIGTAEQNMWLERAYLKRIKRMGMGELTMGQFNHLPEITIVNYTLSGDSVLRLSLKASDSDYELDRINVYVNDVAVYGSKGFSLSDKNTREWEGTLPVPVLVGKNKVEVSLLNANGMESLRQSLTCEGKGTGKPHLYLVAFGAGQYQDKQYDLTYAEKDAADMAKVFAENRAGNYAVVHTHVLLNEQVKKESLEGCRQFLSKAKPGDAVIVFFAGHGVLDKNLDYYLAAYDMDFVDPQQRGIAYDELEALLDGIKPLKKALLIDACHSGELDKDDVMAYASETQAESPDGVKFRTVGAAVKEKTLGVQKTNEMVRELFTDVRKGTGATVISSAGGMEFAQESGQWKNGLFTYCLLEGLKTKSTDLNRDGVIMLSELQKHVSTRVTKLSKGLQQPTSRIENDVLDWVLW